jgi:uncharacterized protein (DUF697 family)
MSSFTLEIRYADRPPETLTFTTDRVTIGREAGDIALHDAQVSGRHAELTFDGAAVSFADLGSTNGSFDVRGQRLYMPKALALGESVRMGSCTVTLQAVGGQADPLGRGRTVFAGDQAPAMAPPPAAPPPPAMAPVATPVPTYVPTGAPAMPPPPVQAPPGGYPPPPSYAPPAHQVQQGVQQAAYAVEQGFQQGAQAVSAEFDTSVSEGAIKAALMRGLDLVKKNPVQALAIYGVFALAPALLSWIPVVGPILGGLVGAVAGLASPLAIGALVYYMLKLQLGSPVGAMDAFRTVLKSAVPVWLSFFVAGLIAGVASIFLIVPGIALGCFIGQVFFVDKQRFFAINMRTLEYFKADVVRIILLCLLLAVPVILGGVLTFVLGKVLGFIPVVGTYLAALIGGLVGAAANVLAATFGVATMTVVYFEVRAKLAGHDVSDEARAALAEFEAGLKGEVGSDVQLAPGQAAPDWAAQQPYAQQQAYAQQQGYPQQQQGYPPPQQQGYPPQQRGYPPQQQGYPPPPQQGYPPPQQGWQQGAPPQAGGWQQQGDGGAPGGWQGPGQGGPGQGGWPQQ